MRLQDLAQTLQCEWLGDPDLEIVGVASLPDAQPGDLSFVSEAKYLPLVSQTQASALIVTETTAVPAAIACLITPHPRLAFAKAIEQFYQPLDLNTGIHSTAVIAADAKLGQEVSIGAHAVIGSGVVIGDRTRIHANVTVYPQVTIGSDCLLFANCVIHERSELGPGCLIHSGAVIGDDGFGHIPQPDGSWYRMLQSGHVVLEAGVDIGSNTTIDRPAVGETRIRTGTKIDNLVQIGHGGQIGPHCVFVSQVGLAGGVTTGHHVVLGGQVGVAGHLTIGDQVTAVARTGITNDVDGHQTIAGFPHQPHQHWLRAMANLRKLSDFFKRIRTIEQSLSRS